MSRASILRPKLMMAEKDHSYTRRTLKWKQRQNAHNNDPWDLIEHNHWFWELKSVRNWWPTKVILIAKKYAIFYTELTSLGLRYSHFPSLLSLAAGARVHYRLHLFEIKAGIAINNNLTVWATYYSWNTSLRHRKTRNNYRVKPI